MGKKNQAQLKTDENGVSDTVVAGGGKGKSKKSRKKDIDEDDIARELEEMQLEANGELPKPKESNDENQEKKSQIQPTAADLTDNNDNMDKQDNESSKASKTAKEKGKKSKKKKKGYDDDDEDIDDLLAQIECEYKGEVWTGPKKKEAGDSAEKSSSNEPDKEVETVKDSAKSKPADSSEKANKKGPKASEPKKEAKNEPKKVAKKDSLPEEKEDSPMPEEKDGSASSKKKKAKTKEDKKKEEEDAKARKGKPNKKMLEAMKLMLAKQKEEEERLKKEMEAREKEEEERIRALEEERRLEEERKERQKQKQKERLKRLKEEGKIQSAKQRQEQKRAQAMLEHLKAQGVAIPEASEKGAVTHVSYKRQRRRKQEEVKEEGKEDETTEMEVEEEKEEEESKEEEIEEEEEEDVVDAWDQLSSDSGAEEEKEKKVVTKSKSVPDKVVKKESIPVKEEKMESEDDEDYLRQSEAEKKRERTIQRMEQRKVENEKKKSAEKLRAPVVCVLGHVDHGKTKILDKLRRTNVQEGEVGGITQQIGATNVPFEAVKSQTRMVKDFDGESMRLPGLLIIDTPGHESFSNLRTRGSSLCDIAILVVDITQGLEPQTIESISLLKNKKTPFVVALNKVDRIFEWESHPTKDIRDIIRLQNNPCKNDFEKRSSEIIQALNMQGLNAALFWENPDPRSYVSLVPTSAISGDGMGNLISLITSMCQKRLVSRLMYSDELQCTVLEVKTIQGHGTTIDVILINGCLREGDTIMLAGTEGPIVTQIRSLLIPKPMKEIRVKGQYDELKIVQAALGVKIAARDLEKAIAGLNLQVAYHEDEVEILKEQVDKEFKAAMKSIKVKDKGVYVQASTLGALEALLEFFKTNKVPYAGIRVGPVVKRDVMKAAAMLEHDPMYAVILAFDVKVEKDAQELADKEGVKIFFEETIYHLGDRYVEYIKDYKKKKQDEFRHVAVFPCKLKIIPDAIFNKRDPIVLGVTVDAGILRTGTQLCVPSKEFVEIGVVTSLEFDHKVVEIAKKGVNVCMKVEPVPGHTPKLFGRHFEADDMLVSKISRESIDACKQYFRDDLGKTEWKLMAELKKQFGIL